MKTLLAMIAVGSVAGLSAQATLVNGSFEDTVQPSGSWNNYSSINGWTGGEYGIELRNNVAGTAADGNNFVELDTYHNSSMFQTVTTTLGGVYNFSFAYAPRAGVAADSNGIEAWFNNTLVASVTGDGTVSSAWTEYTFQVTGTGSDTLLFKAVGTDDSLGGSLDSVAFTATAVPEPSTCIAGALLLLPFGVSAFRGLRKNR